MRQRGGRCGRRVPRRSAGRGRTPRLRHRVDGRLSCARTARDSSRLQTFRTLCPVTIFVCGNVRAALGSGQRSGGPEESDGPKRSGQTGQEGSEVDTKPAGDRRVRRTRAALRQALVELVLDRGFQAITVEEIAERADVGRATFYAHYRDKEDLLIGIVRDLAEDRERLLPALQQARTEGFTGLPVKYIFEHAEQEKPVYRVVLRGEGTDGPCASSPASSVRTPRPRSVRAPKSSGSRRGSRSMSSPGRGPANSSACSPGGSRTTPGTAPPRSPPTCATCPSTAASGRPG